MVYAAGHSQEIALMKKTLRDIYFVLTVFFISRIFIAFGVLLGRKFFFFPGDFHNKILEKSWWESLVRWDAGWYIDIVINGYSYIPDGKTQNNIDFFPLYPLLIRIINYFFGVSPLIIGIALSNAFFLLALLLLYRYTKKYHPDADPDLATVLMAFFPFGVFFSSVYNESLFLLLCLFSFSMFRERKMMASACVLSLMGATRLAGLFVVSAMGLFYLFTVVVHFNKKRPYVNARELLNLILWGLLAVSGFLLFVSYQEFSFGHWDAFIKVQAAFHRHPIGSFSVLLSEMAIDPYKIMNIVPAVAVVGISIVFLFLKNYRLYSLWGFLVVLVPLSTGTFMSMTRFSMVFFPLVIYGSSLLRKFPLSRDVAIMTCSSALIVFTALFVRFYFIG
jgi:Gpi18-like mannosyltransferase